MTRSIQPSITDQRLDGMISDLLTERADNVAAVALSAEAIVDRMVAQRRPTLLGRGWVLLAAGLLAALVIAGALVAGGAVRLPSAPSPALPRLNWTGPVRPDAATMPLTFMERDNIEGFVLDDGRDAAVDWIDIAELRTGGIPRLRWRLDLAGVPPRAATLDPKRRVIEYGVVLDAGGDGIADCLIGINNDAPDRGDFRVWVTDLATGATEVQVGPPYGFPIDFSHPDESPGQSPTMTFFFLSFGSPCDLASRPLRFYAFASMTDAGRVVAWDYAPDASWVAWPYGEDQP